MKLIIEDDEGRKIVVPLVRERITIGRAPGNAIRLTDRNVSREHGVLLVRDGNRVVIEDRDSFNGIRLNGARIRGAAEFRPGDLVEIGDYGLALVDDLPAPDADPDLAATNPPPRPSAGPGRGARQGRT
jgi:pSer/pThr/pTyr-binding forkhead associated (FHA) protein